MYSEVACNNGDESFVAKYIPTIVFNIEPSFALIFKKQGGDGRESLSLILPNMFLYQFCNLW
jgi:hypothetical protein